VLDSGVVHAANASGQRGKAEGGGSVGVDHHRPIDGRERQIVIACQAGAYRSRESER